MKPDDWWERNEREHEQFLQRHSKAEDEMRELRGLVMRLGRLSEAADQRWHDLNDRWRDTNERLNTLIVLFERHLSNGHA